MYCGTLEAVYYRCHVACASTFLHISSRLFQTPKPGTIFALAENILASSLAQESFFPTHTSMPSTFIKPPKAPQLNLPCTFRL